MSARDILRTALFLWAYAAWFLCVFSGKAGFGAATLLIPVITWLLAGVALRPSARSAGKLGALAICGFAFDLLALHQRWITLPIAGNEFPWWLLALWFHFTPSLLLLQPFLGARLLLAAALGSVLGPLSYKSGETFGVLAFSAPLAPWIYAAAWAAFLPGSLLWLRESLRRATHEKP